MAYVIESFHRSGMICRRHIAHLHEPWKSVSNPKSRATIYLQFGSAQLDECNPLHISGLPLNPPLQLRYSCPSIRLDSARIVWTARSDTLPNKPKSSKNLTQNRHFSPFRLISGPIPA